MEQEYKIEGLTCQGCVAKVGSAIRQLEAVEDVQINLSEGKARIKAQNQVDLQQLQSAIGAKGNYNITTIQADFAQQAVNGHQVAPKEANPYQRLFPLFLIFAYLIGVVLLSQLVGGRWNSMEAIRFFMAGFFLTFSFFKFLDLKGFATSFSMYDPIAKRWPGYGYFYPFLELILGIFFFIGEYLFVASIVTLVIVSIGTVGVARAVFSKQTIQCACLGTVFNLPMTKVTMIENSIMMVMAALMILSYIF